jgi:preprotein translocase subunit SecD
LALVAAAVIAILFFGSRFTYETHAAVRFEIRLAETDAAPGLVAAEVRESGRIIYLHPEVLVSNGDVARAELLPGNLGTFVVGIQFTPEAAQRMLAATGSHIDRPLAILIDDAVVMAPTIRTAVGEQAEINGHFTYEHAERIVNGLQ